MPWIDYDVRQPDKEGIVRLRREFNVNVKKKDKEDMFLWLPTENDDHQLYWWEE